MHWVLDVLDGIFRAAVDAGTWLVLGLLLAGFVHEFVPPARLQRLLGGLGLRPILTGTGFGMLLPMCSCGVVPTGIGLQRTGASFGGTLAFMVSAPAMNPAAIILCFALLGPRLTAVYAVTALAGALAVGFAAQRWLDRPAHAAAAGTAAVRPVPLVQLEPDERPPFARRVLAALRWGIWELGVDIGYYVLIGLVIAGAISALVPADVVSMVLGRGVFWSLLLTLAIALPTYVCAVGSIPLVATLLLKGAAPGAAIVFLMAGPATNIGELLAIHAKLGRRAAVIFAAGVGGASLLGGVAANLWLSGLSYEALIGGGGALKAAALSIGPAAARFSCPPSLLPATITLLLLGVVGVAKRVRKLLARPPAPRAPARI